MDESKTRELSVLIKPTACVTTRGRTGSKLAVARRRRVVVGNVVLNNDKDAVWRKRRGPRMGKARERETRRGGDTDPLANLGYLI